MSDIFYIIKLFQFEGFFDLLFFFIEWDELDINDILIVKIIDDFLVYIWQMEEMNIDLASEFILVAVMFCCIKVKMFIFCKLVDEEGNEIDFWEEFVQCLIEYKCVKSVLEEMWQMEVCRVKQFYWGNVIKELYSIVIKVLVDVELEFVIFFKLFCVFECIVECFEYVNFKMVYQIVQFSYIIEGQQEYIFFWIQGGCCVIFIEVFSVCCNRIYVIVIFLVLLELFNLQEI